MSDAGIPAACYARMSTDMQRYSIENQSDMIAFYAASRGFRIVRSYIDLGRSGVTIDGRDALQRLIGDVQSGESDFKAILVYDVSRWGRFQDSDESAYYEYLCKRAGIAVHYCAEGFENDGSLYATLLKNLKRAMAGEFSRELSVKVHAGQSRLTRMGYRVVGAAGYGLRRSIVDGHGKPGLILLPGQQKNLKSDRVILVPGPPNEISMIQRVYELFVCKKYSMMAIARELNANGLKNVTGNPWTAIAVKNILTNEKYVGTSVFNRTSKKLQSKYRSNPESEWVRKSGAFVPLVTPEQFRLAKRQKEENASHYIDGEMLNYLSAIWCREKVLTRDIIDASVAPSTNCYRKHFGCLRNAYKLIGFASARAERLEDSYQIRRRICREIEQRVRAVGGTVSVHPGRTCQFQVNGEFLVSIVIGRSSPSSLALNQNGWRISYRTKRKPDVLVIARVDPGMSEARDYFVLPYLFQPPKSWLWISGRTYRRIERFRSDTLAPLYRLSARTPLETLLGRQA